MTDRKQFLPTVEYYEPRQPWNAGLPKNLTPEQTQHKDEIRAARKLLHVSMLDLAASWSASVSDVSAVLSGRARLVPAISDDAAKAMKVALDEALESI